MRHLAILAAGAAAILQVPSQAAETEPAAAEAFIAPAGPLILTRTLRRALADGKEIVATRRYEVRILPDGAGFRVEGRLLEVTLDAPPALAALGEIERKRSDAGLFPFRLNAAGLIASPAAAHDELATARAEETARQAIAASTLGESDRQQSQTIAGRILAREAGGGGQWPTDLFHPAAGSRSETITQPTGSVTTTVEAHRGRPDAPGDTIERTVTTEVGGTKRVSRETYRIEPAGN